MAEYSTTIQIDAPPEVVFAHLVTPERMIRWMGERADLEPRPGGRFAVDVNGTPFRGQYLEVEPPRRVVVSWGMAGSDEFPVGSSHVEFTLSPTSHGTTLRLVHRGLPEAHARTHGLGWTHYLRRLEQCAEGGEPGPDAGFSRKELDRMTATEVVTAYYNTWNNGPAAFDEARLRAVLHPDLEFSGPIAGARVGAEPFIRGVGDIARALKSFRMIQRIDGDDEVAAMYECDLSRPEGTFRFAEFFRVEEGKIRALNLSYDGTEFRKLTRG